MKKSFLYFINRITLPMCFIMICISVFRDYVDSIPYIFIVRIVMLVGAIGMVIAGIIDPIDSKSAIWHKGTGIKYILYLNSGIIIKQVFVWYFCLYIILRLDKISIVFSFVMLLIFGVFSGYKITNITERYKKEKQT
ncbi:hypothetical protein K8P02_15730 [Bacteroides nordii]|uniref:hypothetical protein n=1 Tax=Bacteroides TaxID=816 RepID=UPI00046F79D7|nr:hypothetical protein [Bacteroides nordii]MCE8463513.1 hypothetical protein [Bacteroides nordii]UAK41614.1 hypothetical protein K8P02_15730 [Bacteroides nordii]UYU49304.1 hypothetical protein KQP55_01500 [Bacteroides nordii]